MSERAPSAVRVRRPVVREGKITPNLVGRVSSDFVVVPTVGLVTNAESVGLIAYRPSNNLIRFKAESSDRDDANSFEVDS